MKYNVLSHMFLLVCSFRFVHLRSQTPLQIGRWWWMWVLWCCTIRTASFCLSRSCTSTRLRRAHLGAVWAPNPATKTANLRSLLLSGCRLWVPCKTVSETAALSGSTPQGWSLLLNPLMQRIERKQRQIFSKCLIHRHKNKVSQRHNILHVLKSG